MYQNHIEIIDERYETDRQRDRVWNKERKISYRETNTRQRYKVCDRGTK